MLDNISTNGSQRESSTLSANDQLAPRPASSMTRRMNIAFAGLGWIGLNRLRSMASLPLVQVAAVADPSPQAREAAREVAPAAETLECFEDLLDQPLDGIVIATPSGLHAEQAYAALQRGLPVFCQKPLARTTCETYCIVNEARRQNLLLGVDFCYRHVAGVQQMRNLIQRGQIGQVYSIELVFHNAYGPNKGWAYDVRQSGGGCAIDLGTHLIDLALWLCGNMSVSKCSSRLYRRGNLLSAPFDEVEDAAFAEWLFDDRIHVRLACSWDHPACDGAEIRIQCHGTKGAVVLRNVNGSFYDFVAQHCCSANCQQLAAMSGNWSAGAITQWAERLAVDRSFDATAERCFAVANLIDAMYQR